MEKIMGEIMQEHVDRLMMLGTLSADEFTELLRGVDFLFLITAKMIATTVG